MKLFRDEPVLVTQLLVGVITAVFALLAAYQLPVSPDQQNAWIGIIAAIGAAVAAFISRSQVTPVANPKTDKGTPLVPAAGGAPAGGAVRPE